MRYRGDFISDTHPGLRGARAGMLLEFVESVDCEGLCPVGDVVNLWEMQRRSVHWPGEHNAVLQNIIGKAASGTRVVHIPESPISTVSSAAAMAIGWRAAAPWRRRATAHRPEEPAVSGLGQPASEGRAA
jgi:hypothetical protein